MATLSQSIKQVYGVSIPSPPSDGKTRNFKIDRFRIGFVVSVGDHGVFGCRYDRIGYKWSAAGLCAYEIPSQPGLPRSRAMQDLMERCVVSCAQGLVRRGESLTSADSQRLERAVIYLAMPQSPPIEADRKGGGLIPQSEIDRANSDIVSVISGYIDLRKTGKNYSARCPFHNEKSPSFSVSPDKQLYYCFGCGAGGNAISFAMDYLGVGFREAVESINGRMS